MSTPHELNVIGAFALAIGDRLIESVDDASDSEGAQAAAVITLSQEPGGRSIREMARALRISHSRAVRIGDALESDGLARRRPSEIDGRAVELRLTAKGRRLADRIQMGRAETLRRALDGLTAKEAADLARLASRVLESSATGTREWALASCRLCDAEGCGHFDGRCPVTNGTLLHRGAGDCA